MLKFLTNRYAVLPVLALGHAAVYLWEKQFEAYINYRFPNLPYGWMAMVFGGVLMGVFIADMLNPASWIREKWRHWRRIFDIKGQYYSHDVRNEREYLYIKVRLTFARNINNADLLLKVYQIQMLPGHQFTLTIAENINKKKDAQEIYTLAVIPFSESENPYWGSPESPTNHLLVSGGRYIASLCIRTPKDFQEHKLYIQIATPKAGNFGKYVVYDESTAALHYLMKPTIEKDGGLFIKP